MDGNVIAAILWGPGVSRLRTRLIVISSALETKRPTVVLE